VSLWRPATPIVNDVTPTILIGVLMRITCFGFALTLLVVAHAPRVDAQQRDIPAKHRAGEAAVYSSRASDFVAGRRVFLRSTKTFIGTISAVDANRKFPRSFPRSRMKAVLIERADGRQDWVPVEGITRIYVTR
jgi:hypothetical protein